MPAEIHLITAQNAHLLEHVADGVFDQPLSAELIAAYCADPAQALFVALSEGRVVGQLKSALHRHPDKPPNLFIEELGTAVDLRRQGIASRLVAAAAAHGESLGCAEMWLATEPENEAANALYKHLGLNGQHVVMYSHILPDA
jgi:aminoglycoside 6'-N-acetyltransferase I